MMLSLVLALSVCGTERWAVKTMSDPGASLVDLRPIETTVAKINAEPAMCSLRFPRRQEFERHVYTVEATVNLVRHEADKDFHIVLLDANGKSTMVVESVDPTCARHSLVLTQIRAVRLDAQRLHAGVRVRVTGVGFYDRVHRQTGMAQSCIELHPILRIEVKP